MVTVIMQIYRWLKVLRLAANMEMRDAVDKNSFSRVSRFTLRNTPLIITFHTRVSPLFHEV